jgi:hypothetical protein
MNETNKIMGTIEEKLAKRYELLKLIKKYDDQKDSNVKELYRNLTFMPSSICDNIEQILENKLNI